MSEMLMPETKLEIMKRLERDGSYCDACQSIYEGELKSKGTFQKKKKKKKSTFIVNIQKQN
jgi:hypothetical protein